MLIAGPTASGKSELALQIAERFSGTIINADAIQVYDGWRVLTARPSAEDEARAPHALYGHVSFDTAYSVGAWLRDVAEILQSGSRPILVGGTGLYFKALTEGLAHIPATPPEIRAEADQLRQAGHMDRMVQALDPQTRSKIDILNPMRVQRAWEVWTATGQGLAEWQANTPPPLLPLAETVPIVFQPDVAWLNARITMRFDHMVRGGALEEARANLNRFDTELLSCKAIGAPELVAHLRGEMDLSAAQDAATIATRQFAKRQRTWFRGKMKEWHQVTLPDLTRV